MNSENITLRRKPRTRTQSESNLDYSLQNESAILSDPLEGTTSSLPDISDDDILDEVKPLKDRIIMLEMQLNSAHEEIESLLQQNSSLKSKNEELITKNQLIKKVTLSPVACKRLTTPKKKQKTEIKNTCTQTEHTIVKNKNISPTVQQKTKQSPTTKNPKINPSITNVMNKDRKNRKLYILSNSNNKTRLRDIEHIFSTNFNFCHYVAPNSGIKELLANIENKLLEFTINDYCLIMMGEKDFKNTENHVQLIQQIRTCLKKITHTNVILCAPTYVLGAPIYNYKIETFNTLLLQDLENHEYAYFFDSNKDLTLDMFTYKTGKLNNYGKRTIFNKIMERLAVDFRNFPLYECNINEDLEINTSKDTNKDIIDRILSDNKILTAYNTPSKLFRS